MKTSNIGRPFFRLPVIATIAVVVGYIGFQAMPLLPLYIATKPTNVSQWVALLARLEVGRMRFAVLIFGSLIYGVIRVKRTHPSLSSSYSKWLTTVPWNRTHALPLGPVGLVWEDLIFGVAVTALATIDFPGMAFVPVAAGLIPYSVGVIAPAVSAGRTARLATYGIVITFAALLPASNSLMLTGLLVAMLTAFLKVIVERTLDRLPWASLLREIADKAAAFRSAEVWPIAPRELPEPIDVLNGVLGSMTLGWITFCIAHQCDTYTHPDDGWTCVILISGSVSLVRLLAYAINFGAPISVFGRLATGRVIIPLYDKIWIAPAVGLIAATTMFALCQIASFGLPAGTALAIGIAFAIALNMGPTRRNWQLTGQHRILFRPEQNKTRSSRQLLISNH